MIWESWNDFFRMGGYGLYVWGSFVVCAIFMLGEVIALNMRRKSVMQQLANARDAGNAMKRTGGTR